MSIYHQAREGNTDKEQLKPFQIQSLAGVMELQPESEVTLTAVLLLILALRK